jgi:hypothetical protein
MATTVKHLLTNKRYIVIGPAYGYSKTNRGNVPYDTSLQTFEEKFIVCCDSDGELHWLAAHEVRVDSVDGRSCREVLNGTP